MIKTRIKIYTAVIFLSSLSLVSIKTLECESNNRRWALLIEHGAGINNLLVNKYRFSQENIIILESATLEDITKHLNLLSKKLSNKDLLLIVVCGHAKAGNFIGKEDISYSKIEESLKKIKAIKVAILETCHSSQAIEDLKSAEVVYAACKTDEECGGGFFQLFFEALGNNEDAFKKADKNQDEKVTLKEAFDYASQEELLKPIYASYDKNWWGWDYIPFPQRKGNFIDYEIDLN